MADSIWPRTGAGGVALVAIGTMLAGVPARPASVTVAVRPLPVGDQGSRHFPSEQAALKCSYPVTRSLDPTGVGRARWTLRWKPALNAFAITFGDRFPAAETY